MLQALHVLVASGGRSDALHSPPKLLDIYRIESFDVSRNRTVGIFITRVWPSIRWHPRV